jgi:phage tail sheath gpL-like
MTISFNQIPSNIRVPLLYAEFDNSRANQGGVSQEYRTLMVGQKLSSGTKAELTLHRVTSAEQAAEYFGAGSVLADMAASFLAINRINPLYCVPIDELSGGVKATGKITATGTATAAGTIALMVGGRRILVGVESGDTAEDVAGLIADAIEADDLCLLDAAQSVVMGEEDECLLTAKNKGVHGNEIEVSYNYADGDELPAGITLAVTAMASGAGNPDMDEVWPVIGDDQYILVVTPFTDATNLTAVETELADRFGPLRQNDGYALYGKRGDFSALTSAGEARNSQFSTLIGMRGPSNPWNWAAEIAARVAASGSNDPAQPFHTLTLNVYAPLLAERFTLEERNQLLFSGIATFSVGPDGRVAIEGLITTFKENAFGSPDQSYLYLNTPLTLSYLRQDWKALVTSKYNRHKLANDGTRFNPGQKIVTPSIIKAEAIAKFRYWEGRGLVENFEQFVEELIVERNTDNPNRLDVLMPPDLVNQLNIVGTQFQFLL